MSVFDGDGRRIVIGRQTRLRDPEAREERDRKVWEALCEGRARPAVAKMFKITVRYVRTIEARIPWEIKREIAADVKRHRRERMEYLSDSFAGG